MQRFNTPPEANHGAERDSGRQQPETRALAPFLAADQSVPHGQQRRFGTPSTPAWPAGAFTAPVHQIPFDVNGRTGPRPQTAQHGLRSDALQSRSLLKKAGAYADIARPPPSDADVSRFFYRDDVHHIDTEDASVAELIVGKQRNVPIGSVPLCFNGAQTRFDSPSPNGAADGLSSPVLQEAISLPRVPAREVAPGGSGNTTAWATSL